MSERKAGNLVTALESIRRKLERARGKEIGAESVLNSTSLARFSAEEAVSKFQSKYEDTLQELSQSRGRLANLADQCAIAINKQPGLIAALDAKVSEEKTLIEANEKARQMVSSTGTALQYARTEERTATDNKAAAEANLVQVRNFWNASINCPVRIKLSMLLCQKKQDPFGDDDARLEIASDDAVPLVFKHKMNEDQIWNLDEVVQFHSKLTVDLYEEDDSGGFGGDDDFLGRVVITSGELDGRRDFTLIGAHYTISWVEGPGMKACELAVSEAKLAVQNAEVARETAERKTQEALQRLNQASQARERIEFELPRVRMKVLVSQQKVEEHYARMGVLAAATQAEKENVLKAEAEAAKFEWELNDAKIKAQEALEQYKVASRKHDEALAKVDGYTTVLEVLANQTEAERGGATECPLLPLSEAAASSCLEDASTSSGPEAESKSRVVEKALLNSGFVVSLSLVVAAVYATIAIVRSYWPFNHHSIDDFQSGSSSGHHDGLARHSDRDTQTDGGHRPWEFKFQPGGGSAATLILAGQGEMRATVLVPERPVAASPFSSETGTDVVSDAIEFSHDHSLASTLAAAAVVGDVHVERD